MEDDLKWKTWSDIPQILDLALYDQSKLYKYFKWRRTQIEDDLKWKTTLDIKSKISQQLLVGSSQNIKFRLFTNVPNEDDLNGRWPQMEDYPKYQKWNISATTGRILPKF